MDPWVGLLSTALGGLIATVTAMFVTRANSRVALAQSEVQRRHELELRALDDARIWRDRSVNTVVLARNYLANNTVPAIHRQLMSVAALPDFEGRRELRSQEFNQGWRPIRDGLTEIGTGHPRENARQLADEARLSMAHWVADVDRQIREIGPPTMAVLDRSLDEEQQLIDASQAMERAVFDLLDRLTQALHVS